MSRVGSKANSRPPAVDVSGVSVGGGAPLCIIAGPCVLESQDLLKEAGRVLSEACKALGLGLILKSSYDKANRTSADSYRGPGLAEGLKKLKETADSLGVPCTTDVHSPEEARQAAGWVDLIQIPAFLCRQTDLLLAAGESGKPVNVKKGQFMAPQAMSGAVEKLRGAGCPGILLTERGTMFGYGDLVVDHRSLLILASLGCPVVYDMTHSQQRPPSQGHSGGSGGQREFAAALGRGAVAVGVDAVFLECHPQPESAKSDADTQLPLDEIPEILSQLKKTAEAVP